MDADVQAHLYSALKAVAPTACDDPNTGGDQGGVYFSDGSEIKYDWDNGDFESEGVRFQYPYGNDDPLWWSD
jgi:phage baseplate assembly protein gpV